MYVAYVTKIKDIRPHSNADRLNIGTVFGNTVIIGKDTTEDDLILYFPIDGQLSEDYCKVNDLVRRKDVQGNQAGGYLDPDKRNIKALTLRGEKSDGLVMPLSSLSTYGDIDSLKEGDTISVFGGAEICKKYIPRGSGRRGVESSGGGVKKKKENHFPTFFEHKDTEQLAYNLSAFKVGDECVITCKMHGTSQRTGYLIKEVARKQNWFQKLLRRPIVIDKSYELITGTRRVVLEDMESDQGYYKDNNFRADWHEFFRGKLNKGETVYYEVVGAVSPGVSIMPSCDNRKTKDKDFIKKYGETTQFSYGCDISKGESAVYVYRMTMCNEDGDVVEYPWDLVKYRCEQMGAKTVPELTRFVISDPDWWTSSCGEWSPGNMVMLFAKDNCDGSDVIDPTHLREGCVVRVNNAVTFKAFKHKSWHFKILEGIIKEVADAPDLEEAQDEV